MPDFVHAQDLTAGFYADVIAPQLEGTAHAAGLLGWGSDVLGYDTARSMDHGWGPRLVLLVDEGQVEPVRQRVEDALPHDYQGVPVRFGWDTHEPGHHITVATLGDWLRDHLGFDASQGISQTDWLVTPQQQILGVVRGRVYADDGRLAPVRDALSWYPDELWRWMLACQWSRIAQEEPFVQRTHEVGDELGSRVVTARLVRDVMRLALLQSRTYAPYTKWLGTAFARLGHPDGLDQALADAVAAGNFADRERALVTAYELVARRHNALGITAELDPAPRPFFDRPALILGAGRFTDACLDAVTDPQLKSYGLIGAIDQFVDSTDVLSQVPTYRRLVEVYQ
ncbi:DUF4037 domain-containing protein [Kribbella shirazensis]|uniref:DUF4037 domain-containing protein n=1 Tax=Kribbella shirazensis TaxID=1105143 RepID=A0A7X6A2T8_9ACTN|nr:DUF4037 domain-containing protein [Kribbella shirazensis]NIK58609.1 hypothetical protein [Kribbella shirazensis]